MSKKDHKPSVSPYAKFKTNEQLETKGINLDFGDFAIRIARAGGSNKAYNTALIKHLKPHRKAIQAGTIHPDVQRKVMAEVYAESVILGWAGVLDEEGNVMDYNHENVVKLLTDLPELFNQIMADAENYRLFKEDENEDIAKN